MKNNIDTLRERAGFTVEELAEKIGTKRTMLDKLRRGERRLNQDWLERLAEAMHCKPTDIIDPDYTPPGLSDRSAPAFLSPLPKAGLAKLDADQEYIKISYLDLTDLPGELTVEEDYGKSTGEALMFPREWLYGIADSPHNLRAADAWDDDMEPTIMRGDQVLVDLIRRKLQQGGIFLLNHDGSPAMRRVYYNPQAKNVHVIGDNPKCPAYDADPALLKVVGRIVWQGRRL